MAERAAPRDVYLAHAIWPEPLAAQYALRPLRFAVASPALIVAEGLLPVAACARAWWLVRRRPYGL